MLLIISDIFKAMWILIFPAVELVQGKIQTTENLCQVTGFFFAVGIELSDLSVSLIAIHTALYIFRGNQGLYVYRKAAYALTAIIAIVMAALAFAESPGYVNTGQFCYLPYTPLWKRLLLSWIPRMLALVTILILCIAIYIYVRVWMHKFASSASNSRNTQSLSTESEMARSDFMQQHATPGPPTPLFLGGADHDHNQADSYFGNLGSNQSTLLSSPQQNHGWGMAHPSQLHSGRASRRGSAWTWASYNFGAEPASPTTHSARLSTDAAHSSKPTDELQPLPELPTLRLPTFPRGSAGMSGPPQDDHISQAFENGSPPPSPTRKSTISSKISAMKRGSGRLSIVNVLPQRPKLRASNVIKTREKILRQVRLLFIYPIVYFAVWILPFIVYLTGYGRTVPFDLRLVSIVSLSIQGLVNALVFSLKEKPWRHARPITISGLKFWNQRGLFEARGPFSGRTREEMMVDGRLARKRRDQEMAALKLERDARQSAQNGSTSAAEGRDEEEA